MIFAVLVAFFAAAFVLCQQKFFKKIARIRAEVWETTAYLTALPGGSPAGQKSNIERRLEKFAVVTPLWREFERQLETYDDGDGLPQYRSTKPVGGFFSFERFTEGVNVSFWLNFGTIFAFIGAVFAFILPMSDIYGINAVDFDGEIFQESLTALTDKFLAGFVAALFGVLCAMLYGYAANARIRALRGDIRELTELLERLFYRPKIAPRSDVTLPPADINPQLFLAIADMVENKTAAQTQKIFDKLTEGRTIFNEQVAKLQNIIAETAEIKATPPSTEAEVFAAAESMMTFMKNMQTVLTEQVTETEKISRDVNAKLLSSTLSIGDLLNEHAEKELRRQRETATSVQNMLTNVTLLIDDKLKNNTTAAIGLQNQILDDAQINMQDMFDKFERMFKTEVGNLSVEEQKRREREANDNKEAVKTITEDLRQNVTETLSAAKNNFATELQAELDEKTSAAVRTLTASMTTSLDEAAMSALKTATDLLSEAAVSAVTNSTAKLTEILDAATDTLKDNRDAENRAAQDTLQNIETASSAIKNMTEEIKQMSAALVETRDPLAQTAQNLTKATTAFTEQINKSQRATKKLHKDIADRMKQLVALIGDEKAAEKITDKTSEKTSEEKPPKKKSSGH